MDDGAATVVGSRNVGDVYFGAADDGLFLDLDVLAVGPVAREVSADFDRYWNSASAYPAARILPPVRQDGLAAIAAAAERVRSDPSSAIYVEAVRASSIAVALRDATLAVTLAPVRVVSDDPAKGLGLAPRQELLWPALTQAIGAPRRSLRLVSGYFVPTVAGVEAFADLARAGVNVAILTNALRATDVPVVHAGYAGYRAPLLRAGVRLFQLHGIGRAPPPKLGEGTVIGGSVGGGSSASALHAKTFVVDDERLFV